MKEYNIEAVMRQKRETKEREKGRKIEPSLFIYLRFRSSPVLVSTKIKMLAMQKGELEKSN